MRRPLPVCDTCDTTSKSSVSRFLQGSTPVVGGLRHYIARKTKTENQNTKFLKNANLVSHPSKVLVFASISCDTTFIM